MSKKSNDVIGSLELARIHHKANRRKVTLYWLGFLAGVLASDHIETLEIPALRAESEKFLEQFVDNDVSDLIADIDAGYTQQEEQLGKIIESILQNRSAEFVDKSEKDALNEFFGFCAGIASDGKISVKEIEVLLRKVALIKDFAVDERICRLEEVARIAVRDGNVSMEESNDVCSWITTLVGESFSDTGMPTYGNTANILGIVNDPSKVTFTEKKFVITGKFRIGTRSFVEQEIEKRGGASQRVVSMQTNFLAVALEPSLDWKLSHEGTKIAKARELAQSGADIVVISEKALIEALMR